MTAKKTAAPAAEQEPVTPEQEITPESVMAEEWARRAAATAPAEVIEKVTVAEFYIQSMALIRKCKVDNRLNENTALKTFELSLMWVLNNRQGPERGNLWPQDMTQQKVGDEDEGVDHPEEDGPIPDEIITAIEEEGN